MVKAAHPTEGLEPLVKTYAAKQLTPTAKVILAPYQSRQFNYIQYSSPSGIPAPAPTARPLRPTSSPV